MFRDLVLISENNKRNMSAGIIDCHKRDNNDRVENAFSEKQAPKCSFNWLYLELFKL
jgi:hypothetical protein